MKTGISTDCICDLPEKYLQAHAVDVMHFYIHTDTGRFRDGEEITSSNVLEYMERGGQILDLKVPDPKEYKAFYEKALQRYDEIIYIATGDQASMSYACALEALTLLRDDDAKRVTLVDSEQVSTGLGHMVLRAVALRDSGKGAAEIAENLKVMKRKISTSFIVPNADYLYQMGKVNKMFRELCRLFTVHPVLGMRHGRITVKALHLGHYEKAVMRYVRSELKRAKMIDRKQLFITHAGCPARIIARVKAEAERCCPFENMTVTVASAAVSSNCGPRTVGILFVHG